MDNAQEMAPAQMQQGTLIEHELLIAAPAERVWEALTSDVFAWWSHSFSEKPHLIALEAKLGGRFFELFDEQGNGALYGTVTYCQPPLKLQFSGQMGMQAAVLNHCAFSLEHEEDGGTRLKLTHQMLGSISPDVVGGYRAGWGALLGQLKGFIEEGRKYR